MARVFLIHQYQNYLTNFTVYQEVKVEEPVSALRFRKQLLKLIMALSKPKTYPQAACQYSFIYQYLNR